MKKLKLKYLLILLQVLEETSYYPLKGEIYMEVHFFIYY